jgi:putative transposase
MHGKPEILNSDQGSQFISPVFTQVSIDNEVKISMDGKGRALDNIYIKRFGRSIKYEHIYLNPPNGGIQLYQGIKNYVDFYNNERRHTCLNNQAPGVFFNSYQKVS